MIEVMLGGLQNHPSMVGGLPNHPSQAGSDIGTGLLTRLLLSVVVLDISASTTIKATPIATVAAATNKRLQKAHKNIS